LTEIYLWHACSYHEVEDGNARPGGVLLYAVVIGIALHGETTAHFIGALACIGLGWNFIYTSGSALLVKVSAAAVTGEGQGQWRQGQWQWWQWCCVCPPCMLHTPHAGCFDAHGFAVTPACVLLGSLSWPRRSAAKPRRSLRPRAP
jgi:hypothetical protein